MLPYNQKFSDSQKSNGNIEDDGDEAEVRERLKQAVFRAATDTAVATQNIEGSSARRAVAEVCQCTNTFKSNALREVSSSRLL